MIAETRDTEESTFIFQALFRLTMKVVALRGDQRAWGYYAIMARPAMGKVECYTSFLWRVLPSES